MGLTLAADVPHDACDKRKETKRVIWIVVCVCMLCSYCLNEEVSALSFSLWAERVLGMCYFSDASSQHFDYRRREECLIRRAVDADGAV